MHTLTKRVTNARLSSNRIIVEKDAVEVTLKGKAGATQGNVTSDLNDGTWKLSGDTIEITLGKTVYKGIVSPQWSWERNKGVLSISAISGKGEAIWTNRV